MLENKAKSFQQVLLSKVLYSHSIMIKVAIHKLKRTSRALQTCKEQDGGRHLGRISEGRFSLASVWRLSRHGPQGKECKSRIDHVAVRPPGGMTCFNLP